MSKNLRNELINEAKLNGLIGLDLSKLDNQGIFDEIKHHTEEMLELSERTNSMIRETPFPGTFERLHEMMIKSKYQIADEEYDLAVLKLAEKYNIPVFRESGVINYCKIIEALEEWEELLSIAKREGVEWEEDNYDVQELESAIEKAEEFDDNMVRDERFMYYQAIRLA